MIDAIRDGDLISRKYRTDDAVERFNAIAETKTELSRWFNWCRPDYSAADNLKWIQDCQRL